MMERALTRKEEGPAAAIQGPVTDTIYAPEVDIRETVDEVVLTAAMPGVEREQVDVTVENGVLRIEGRGAIELPAGYTLVGQEYEVGRYRRDFELTSAVDPAGIKAQVRQGLLTVRVPKRDEVRKRKVEVLS
jgi:HSP20 family protein